VSPTAFAFSPDSSMLVVGTQEGRVYGFTIADGKLDHPYKYSYEAGQPSN
jgi:hypothetical protein